MPWSVLLGVSDQVVHTLTLFYFDIKRALLDISGKALFLFCVGRNLGHGILENAAAKRIFLRLPYFKPNKVFKPKSTPLNPMNANDNSPAVTSTIGIPLMPLGMLT